MSEKQSSGGIGFLGLLTLVFIVLRLLEVICWSWWWVLAPIWIPIGLVLLWIVIYAIVVAVKGDE